MSMLDKARLVIYRIKEKGLEIFLVNTGDQWEFPEIREASKAATDPANHIELDPVSRTSDGQAEKGLAVEGDWHDIPSLKKLLPTDGPRWKRHLLALPHSKPYTAGGSCGR